MAIAYKIVTNERKSVASSIYEYKKCLGEYIRTYKKETIVNAIKGSQGIYCFKTKEQAEAHQYYIWNGYNTFIIKVRGIKKGRKPDFALILSSEIKLSEIMKLYKKEIYIGLWDIPEGTICYDSVEVLN